MANGSDDALGAATSAAMNGGSGRGYSNAMEKATTQTSKWVKEVEKIEQSLKRSVELALQVFSGPTKSGKGKSQLGLANVPSVPGSSAADKASQSVGGGPSSGGTRSNGQPEPSFGYKMGYATGAATAGAASTLPWLGPVAAGVATMFPGTQSGVDRQQALFQLGMGTGSIGAGASNAYGALGLATFGNYMTSVNSDVRSMAIASNYGFNPMSASGKSMLGQIGSMSLTTGMANEQIAQAVFSQSTNPVMANRLLMLGINQTSGGVGGGPQSVAQLANKLVRAVYNNPTPEKIRAGIRPGGALDMMIQSYIPDPTMQELVRDAMLKMALNNGNPISNNQETMSRLGLGNSMNNPRVAGMRSTSVETSLSERFRQPNVMGYTGALDAASNLTESFIELSKAIGPVADAFATMNSGFGTFMNTRPGSAISTTVSGIVQALLSVVGLADGGTVKGPGTGTSDSIPALLSNGEFVMKASSVQKYGEQLFEALNAQKFDTGGKVTGNEIANYASSFAGKVGYSGPAGSGVQNTRPPGVAAADPTKPETWANGWGCSEFTRAIYKQYGIDVGSYSVEQFHNGVAVDRSNLQPGDLVFFSYHDNHGAGNPDHVGIYTGNGKMVEAEGSNTGTKIDDVDWNYYLGARRYLTGSETSRPSVAASASPTTTSTSNTFTTPQIGRSQPVMARSIFNGVSITQGWAGTSIKSQSILDVLTDSFSSIPLVPLLRSSSTGSGGLTGAGTAVSMAQTAYTGGNSGVDFAKWLYSKGLTGTDLENMWTIGMRESNGQNLGPGDSAFNGSDYGIFQINKVHADMVAKHGWTMTDLVDPDKNFAIMRELSNNGTNLYPWAVDAATGQLDWRDYASSRDAAIARYSWIPDSENAYYSLRSQVKDAMHKAGIPGYSGGAWSIGKDQTARIHQGEMILPANVAEIVRTGMREGLAGQGSGTKVIINVTVASGSDADAMRLVNKVKEILEEDSMLMSISGVGA